jgi:hypothetical protein
VSPSSTTPYTLYAQTEEGCVASEASAAVVTVSVLSPGEITSAFTTVTAGATPPNVTITNVTAATGGNIAYQWRRTGTSSATLTGSAVTYAINNNVINYYTSGTHYFNRYVRDATCNTEWVAAAGTYTLYVISPAPGTFSTTFCKECCWNGSWVDCHVTTNAYSFDDAFTNTGVQWIGNDNRTYFDGARSDKNGRANFTAITSSSVTIAATSAVGLCKALGDGWYLPAYEELYNMRTGTATAYGNQRAGGNVLTDYYHWSSTEYYNNGGRENNPAGQKDGVVVVNYNGTLGWNFKDRLYFYVRCAWRP